MQNNLGTAISLVAVMGIATAAQAADAPMSPQDLVRNVAENCMKGFDVGPWDADFDATWKGPACKEAMELSTSNKTYVMSMAFDQCQKFESLPLTYLGCQDEVIRDNSDARTIEAQETIEFLAEMALDGFPTAKGILNKEMREYANDKGIYIAFDWK